jgi:hypothetical protein
MEALMNNRLLTLAHGDVVELPDAAGTTLRVTRGELWITQERDVRDVLLASGDAWTVERNGLTVAQARGGTSVLLAGGFPGNAAVRSHRLRLSDRLSAWLRREGERWLRRRWVPHV